MVCLLRQQIDPFGKNCILRGKIGYANIRRKYVCLSIQQMDPLGKTSILRRKIGYDNIRRK